MKIRKSLLSIGFSILFTALGSVGFAQSSVFKLNIFSPLVKTFNISYEQKVKPSNSVQLGFFYTGFSVSETEFRGIGLTPEYRFYLSDTDAPKGVFIAPFVRYQNFKLEETTTNSKGTLNTFGGGLIIGKQWIFKERISLDTFIGPVYQSGDVKVTSGTNNFETGAFNGFSVRAGLTLGVAF